MSNKNRKFKSNNKSSVQKRVVRRVRFDRHGHLINTMLKPENSLVLERNLNDASSFASNEIFEEVEEFVFKDEEFNEARENTIIVDEAGKEVNDDVKAEAHRQIVHQGTEDALYDVIENQDIEYTKESFIQRAKKNILDRFDFLRSNAEKDNEKTQEKSLLGRFKKKVKVYAGDVLSMFEDAKKATKAYEQKIADKAPTVKAKVLWNKVKQHKYKIAAGFASVILLTACVTDTNKKATEKKVDQTEKTVKASKPAPAPVKQQDVKQDSIFVQTEYSDSIGISKAAFDRTKSFFGDKYEFAKKRLMTNFPDQNPDIVLNQIAYNLTSYEEATICKWENALNNNVKDDAAQEKVTAYRAALDFYNYLVGCNDTKPENLNDLFIAQQMGDKQVSVNVTNRDCGELEIKFQNIQSKKKAKEFVAEEKEEVAPADTTVTQQDFTQGGGSVEFKEQNVQNDSIVGANFTYNKSNEAFKDSKELRDADANEVLGRRAKDKTIMVEVASTDAPANGSATYNKGNDLGNGKVIKSATNEEAAAQKVADKDIMLETASANGSSATYNKGNDLGNGKVIKGATNDEAAAQKVADKDIMLEQAAPAKQAVASNQTGFKDLTGEKTDSVAAPVATQTGFKDLTASADNAAPAAQQTGFKDLTGGEKTDSVAAPVAAQTGFKDLTGEKKVEKAAEQKAAVASVDSTSYEVIVGTDGVEEGTPALGSVEPRGGYNHTGTLKGPEYSKKFIGSAEKYENAIQNGENHKEWFARNGFAEGLTPHALVEITALYTEVFPYSEVTAALRKTVICGDTLSVEMSAKVKDAIDKFNLNHTIDGVQYNNPTQNVGIEDNGCGEKVTAHIEQRNVSKVTNPSTPKPLRMFQVFKNVQQAFGIGGGSVEYVTLPQELVKKAAAFTYNKSNEGFKNSMKLSDVDGSKVFGLQPKDKTIMVEVSGTAPAQGVATYNKSNEGFGNSQTITTVPADEAAGRKPQNKKVYIEQDVTQQAIAQKKMNTQS